MIWVIFIIKNVQCPENKYAENWKLTIRQFGKVIISKYKKGDNIPKNYNPKWIYEDNISRIQENRWNISQETRHNLLKSIVI